jgi:hypothetical protein
MLFWYKKGVVKKYLEKTSRVKNLLFYRWSDYCNNPMKSIVLGAEHIKDLAKIQEYAGLQAAFPKRF